MNRTQDAFAFLKMFEDTVAELSAQTEDGEALEQLRRRVVDKVLREIRVSNGSKGREHET
jgi:hypothetical protein